MNAGPLLLLTSVDKDAMCIWLRSLQSFFLVSKISSQLARLFISTIFMVSFQFSTFFSPFSFSSEYINDTTQYLFVDPLPKRIALRGRFVCLYTRYDDPLVHISNTVLLVFLF